VIAVRFSDVHIPLHLAWSSPFARWQTDLADIDSLDLAVQATDVAFTRGGQDPAELSGVVLGITVPQHRSFYGGPTLAGRIGAPHATGPMISQACATSAASLAIGGLMAEADRGSKVAVITTDRTSNGPTVVYPSSRRPGNTPVTEAWVLDNFSYDPWAQASMIAAAENVAAAHDIPRHQLDEVTLLRYEQYQKGLTLGRPWEVAIDLGKGRSLDADVGVFPTTAEGLARLQPVEPDGVITYGTQTHPRRWDRRRGSRLGPAAGYRASGPPALGGVRPGRQVTHARGSGAGGPGGARACRDRHQGGARGHDALAVRGERRLLQ
jgi:acetyl-CoA acetyltransferase